MALACEILYRFEAWTRTTSENETASIPRRFDGLITLTHGTGAGQVDRAWSDRRTVALAGTDTLDLAGSLVDSQGAVLTFAKVLMLAIRNRSATDGEDLEDGPAAAAGFAGFWDDPSSHNELGAGGFAVHYAPNGRVVTPTTADKIEILNAGTGAIDYDILVIGRSA